MVEDAKRQDMIKQLEKSMEERKEQYLRFKDTLQGLRLTNISSTNKDIFAVVEVMAENFKNDEDRTNILTQFVIILSGRIETLEKEVKQLKKLSMHISK